MTESNGRDSARKNLPNLRLRAPSTAFFILPFPAKVMHADEPILNEDTSLEVIVALLSCDGGETESD
jgi:hypothetical protein